MMLSTGNLQILLFISGMIGLFLLVMAALYSRRYWFHEKESERKRRVLASGTILLLVGLTAFFAILHFSCRYPEAAAHGFELNCSGSQPGHYGLSGAVTGLTSLAVLLLEARRRNTR